MKKKIRPALIAIAVLLACLMLLLCACESKGAIYAQTQYYSVYSRNGQWFMKFHPKHRGSCSSDNSSANIAVSYPHFDSLSDMQKKIQSGDIDFFDLSGLYYQSKDSILPICDLNNLQDLVTPKGLTYSSICLWGDDYSFEFETAGINGTICCADQDSYEYALTNDYTDYLQGRTVVADSLTPDRNARVVYWKNKVFQHGDPIHRDIFYSIETESQTLYIRESSLVEYVALVPTEDALKNLDISNCVPKTVYIFGNDGTHYFYGSFSDFTERPSLEWLSSFGLKPHIGEPTALIGLSIGLLIAIVILAVAGYREKRRRLAKEEQSIR